MILVTGAGGTVGSTLVGELRAVGQNPRVAYHSKEKAEQARSKGLDAVAVDYARRESLPPALAGVDRLFLLGAGGRGQTEAETAVVEAAKAAGVRRLVKLSVIRAETEAYSFAKIHRAVEKAIEASGLAWTFLRPNGFMQNFANYLAPTIKAQNAFYQPAGDARISHVDVRDIARVAAAVLTRDGHDGKAYDLTGPQALSYAEAADVLSRVLGRKITYVALSDDDARKGMIAAGIPDFYADLLVDLNRYYREGHGARVSGDVKSVTGKDPIAFEQFARDSAGAFR